MGAETNAAANEGAILRRKPLGKLTGNPGMRLNPLAMAWTH